MTKAQKAKRLQTISEALNGADAGEAIAMLVSALSGVGFSLAQQTDNRALKRQIYAKIMQTAENSLVDVTTLILAGECGGLEP